MNNTDTHATVTPLASNLPSNEPTPPNGSNAGRYAFTARGLDAAALIDAKLLWEVPSQFVKCLESAFPYIQVGDYLVRTYDFQGQKLGFRRIAVRGRKWQKIAPKGETVAGRLLMNEPARAALQQKSAGGVVLFVEGEPDFLTWCQLRPDLPVFGLPGSGSWTPEFGAAIKGAMQGRVVVVRTDIDRPGNAYADQIKTDLPNVDVRRWTPAIKGQDQNDLLRAGILAPGADPLTDTVPMPLPPVASLPIAQPRPAPPRLMQNPRAGNSGDDLERNWRLVRAFNWWVRKLAEAIHNARRTGGTHGPKGWYACAFLVLRAAAGFESIGAERSMTAKQLDRC